MTVGRGTRGARRVGRGAQLLLGALGAALVACGRKAPRRAVDTAKSVAAPAQAGAADSVVSPLCTSEDEAAALACSGELARRSGDTLFVRRGAGDSLFVSNPADGDQHVDYIYRGRLSPTLHVVEVRTYESGFASLFDGRTGRGMAVAGVPVPSTSGKRMVAVSLDLDDCEGENAIQILRTTDGLPAVEWTWRSEKCGADATWGPESPRWIGDDSLEVVRVENVPAAEKAADRAFTQYPRRKVMVVRGAAGWEFRESSAR